MSSIKTLWGGVLNRKHKKQDSNKESRFKLSGTRLALSILVFLLGFIGIGLLQNITTADDTNPNNETVDCNFYVFIHDDSGNPMSGVKVNAYDDVNKTNLIGTSSPSETNGWAHLTTCKAGYKSYVYFKPDISTLPEGQKKYQKGSTQVLETMVNVDALTKGFFGDEYIIESGTSVDTNEPAVTKASSSLGEVFPGANLDPNGIVGYDSNRYESWLYSYHQFLSFEILPGEPEEPDPEEPDPEQPDPVIETGNLQITKTTSDNNTTDSFNVTVTLSGTSTDGQSANTISGQYGDVVFDDGIATFTIKHNQTINITGLPAGLNYTVEETNPGSYTVSYQNQTGIITKDQTKTITINNEKVTEPEPATEFSNIKITKKTSDHNTVDSFNVSVSLYADWPDIYYGNIRYPISGEYGDVTFLNGKAEFSIKHGQTVNITNIPAGLVYLVEEEDTEEYIENIRRSSDRLYKDETAHVELINNKETRRKYTLWLKKEDGDTGEDLHDWEFHTKMGNMDNGEWHYGYYDDFADPPAVLTEENNKFMEVTVNTKPNDDENYVVFRLANGVERRFGKDNYSSVRHAIPHFREIIHPQGYFHEINPTQFSIHLRDLYNIDALYLEDYRGSLFGKKYVEIRIIDEENAWLVLKNYKPITYIQKTDENNNPLAGATLELTGTNIDGEEIYKDTWVSGEEAREVVAPEPGFYSIKETKTPKGYGSSYESYNFCLTSDGLFYYGISEHNFEQPCEVQNGTISRKPTTPETYSWAIHAPYPDERYTFTIPNQKVPYLDTVAVDNSDQDKTLKSEAEVVVKDTVEYLNLEPNKEYIMSGELVNKSNGTVITTSTTPFVVDETGQGTVEVLFNLNTKDLAGQELVVYETILDNDITIAEHKDLQDQDQTVIVEKKEQPLEIPKEELPPVEVINPKTEDKKLTTLIIMMGSAVVLVLALVSRRTVVSRGRE